MEQSFTCNVWEGCWATESSDSLCAWAMRNALGASSNAATDWGASPEASTGSGANPQVPPNWGASPKVPRNSGASPMAPTERLQAVAAVVARAMPHLKEAGVPIVVAHRAIASAIMAIHRSRGRATFASAWADDHLALGFLHGALKAEWTDEGASPCQVSNLPSSLSALRRSFGVRESQVATMAVQLDCIFCDTDLSDSAGEGEVCGLPQ